ncbi:MAG: OmpA family protein, partial [Cytophagaceae bacterium]
SETDPARSAIPAALAGMLGWLTGPPAPGPVTSAVPASGVTQAHREEDKEKAAGFPWLRWVLIGAGLLLLLFLLMRSCNRDNTETTTASQPRQESTTSVATDTLASDLDGNAPDVRVAVDLPGGRKLSLVEKSFTYSLAQFLATKGGKVPKVFTFDNLTFETDSARITAQARPNVDDLIQIMKAYPSLSIRIEGNTDSTGDDAINDPLSGDRADAVRQALLAGGIEASRVTTRERGDSKPVASNQTAAGRQKNRRIDVVITKL